MKSSEKYVYIFVRQDLPVVHQIVQTNHASWQMSSRYGDESVPNIVLIGVADVTELHMACRLLLENQIPHWRWSEPEEDLGFGFTAIATAPIAGAQRACLVHFKTWKEEFVTAARGGIRVTFDGERPPVCAISSTGRAADSNSAGCGFDSHMAFHAAVAQ